LFFLALKGQQHTSPGQRPGVARALPGRCPGVALGWYVAALSGLRKIKSFWELAILVTLIQNNIISDNQFGNQALESQIFRIESQLSFNSFF